MAARAELEMAKNTITPAVRRNPILLKAFGLLIASTSLNSLSTCMNGQVNKMYLDKQNKPVTLTHALKMAVADRLVPERCFRSRDNVTSPSETRPISNLTTAAEAAI